VTASISPGASADQPPPNLNSAADVPSFLQWAYQSRPTQVGQLRSLIRAQIGSESIAAAIVTALNGDSDLGEDLVAISLLGELRTQAGFTYFKNLLQQPLPTTGTTISNWGDPIEQVALVKLQARAIDGLAMMRSAPADAVILSTVSSTASIVVRARAVHDYLFIHGTSGRPVVSALLPSDQQILTDRLDVTASGQPYNTRLTAYLAKHPEVAPPSHPPITQ
jgi:hypothetical protein